MKTNFKKLASGRIKLRSIKLFDDFRVLSTSSTVKPYDGSM